MKRRKPQRNQGPREDLLGGNTNHEKSEPTKWLPILLSIIAVSISCLSWLESHRGRVINEDVNRPELSLTISDQVLGGLGENPTQFKYLFFIKNEGKTTAEITSLFANSKILEGPDCGPEPKLELDLYPKLPWSLPPGSSMPTQATITYPCKTDIRPSLLVGMKAEYFYPGTGAQYTQIVSDAVVKPSPAPTRERKIAQ